MANKILIKRSSVAKGAGAYQPTTALDLGELAINTREGRLFAKKNVSGTESIVDLTRNDPISVYGDATSSYNWNESTYTSEVTVSLINSGVTAGSYGLKSTDTIQNGGNIRIPTFSVYGNGIVNTAGFVTISASDFGTMAVQDASNINVTGGAINGTTIGLTTPAEAQFSNVTLGNLTINDNLTLSHNATISGGLNVGGTQGISGNLNVTGNSTIAGNTSITGNTSIGGNASVVYDLTVQGNVSVGGKLYSNDITATSITVDGNTIITGDLTVQGTTTTVNSTTVAVGDLNITLAKDAASAAEANGAGITVAGPATPATITYNGADNSWNLNKTTNVTGAVTVSSTLGVTGATTLDSTLAVTGATTLTGLLTTNGGISADGGVFTVADTTGDVHTSGDLDVDGTLTVNTNASVDGVLTLSDGNTSAHGLKFVANPAGGTGDVAWIRYFNYGVNEQTNLEIGVANDASGSSQDSINFVSPGGVGVGVQTPTAKFDVGGTVHASGAVTFDSDLTVGGAVSLGGDVDVVGNFSVNTNKFTVNKTSGETHILGSAWLANDLQVAGHEALTGYLTVGGTTTLSDTLAVTGATTLSSTLGVTGATTLSSTLGVTGASTLTGLVTASNGIKDSTLTSGRITFAGTQGRLTDSANLTWDGSTLAVTGNQTLSGNLGVTGNETVGGTLTVTGATTLNSSLTVAGNVDVGSGKFTVDSTSGDAYTAGNLTVVGALNAAALTATSLNGAPIGQSSAASGTFTDLKTSHVVDHQVVFAGTGNVLYGNPGFEYTTTGNVLTVQNISVTSQLDVAGDFKVNTNKFTVTASSGNTGVAGTLSAAGDFAVATTKFTVAASSGNTATAGTLDAAGDFKVNSTKFTVEASSGNTAIVGTLGVQGATTLSNTLDVTGAASFAEVVTLTKNAAITLGNYATGALVVQHDVSIDGDLQVHGKIYKAGYEVINTVDTIDGGTY